MSEPNPRWFQVGRAGVANAAVSVALGCVDSDPDRALDLLDWARTLGHPQAKNLRRHVAMAKAMAKITARDAARANRKGHG